jgi:hypothetical protein
VARVEFPESPRTIPQNKYTQSVRTMSVVYYSLSQIAEAGVQIVVILIQISVM